MNQRETEFIPFDVKSVSLMAGLGSSKYLDYVFTMPKPSSHSKHAELYFVRFEGMPEYTAILPKVVFESASGVAYGINGLISGVPYLFHPYMVHHSQLAEAIRSLMDPNADYKNPTTGVTFTGFRPTRTKAPHIGAVAKSRQHGSMTALRRLWDALEKPDHDVSCDINPIAPFTCDFLMNFPHIKEAIRIEHKVGSSRVPSLDTGEYGQRSPYDARRLWHFLIFQGKDDADGYICLARHEVDDSWAEEPPLLSDLPNGDDLWFRGKRALERMLEKIRTQSARAVEEAENIVRATTQKNFNLEAIVTSNQVDRFRQRMVDAEEEANSQAVAEEAAILGSVSPEDTIAVEDPTFYVSANGRSFRKLGAPIYGSVALPGMCDELNQHCREAGFMICFPLDHGHPLGNHLLVDHTWTQREREDFDRDRTLPGFLFSPEMKHRAAVVLRFVDFASQLNNRTFPLWMQRAYWTKPAAEQQFLFLGNTLSTTKVSGSRLTSSYLLYPSEFTTMFDQGCREATLGSHQGLGYFRPSFVMEDALPLPHVDTSHGHGQTVRFDKDSTFIKEGAADPLRCIIDLYQDRSVYRHLSETLRGSGTLSIANPQSELVSPGFSKDRLQTDVQSVMQATWDLGRKQCHQWLISFWTDMRNSEETPCRLPVNTRGNDLLPCAISLSEPVAHSCTDQTSQKTGRIQYRISRRL